MKVTVSLACAFVLAASVAGAQAPAGGGQKPNFATGLQRSYATLKLNLTETAEKLGEAEILQKVATGKTNGHDNLPIQSVVGRQSLVDSR